MTWIILSSIFSNNILSHLIISGGLGLWERRKRNKKSRGKCKYNKTQGVYPQNEFDLNMRKITYLLLTEPTHTISIICPFVPTFPSPLPSSRSSRGKQITVIVCPDFETWLSRWSSQVVSESFRSVTRSSYLAPSFEFDALHPAGPFSLPLWFQISLLKLFSAWRFKGDYPSFHFDFERILEWFV